MENEVLIFNTDKNLYLYIQDNQSDEDCDTEYTVYNLYGNEQDGGILSAENYGLDTDQKVINWIMAELKWVQDQVVRLDQIAVETFYELVTEWEAKKISAARQFMSFKMDQEEKWKKRQ